MSQHMEELDELNQKLNTVVNLLPVPLSAIVNRAANTDHKCTETYCAGTVE